MNARLGRMLISSVAAAGARQERLLRQEVLEEVGKDVDTLNTMVESSRKEGTITSEEYVTYRHQLWRLREVIEEKRKKAGLTGPSP